jgi:hypothetical protein
MKKSNFLIFGLILLFTAIFSSCDDNEAGSARLVVKLIDAPADYEEVNVDIQAVEVNVSGDGNDSGWMELETNTGIYNLLELTNGLSVVLADEEIPAGRISQIRLILGENNTLKMDDQVHDLSTPSAQQSGLKIQLHTDLEAGITYEVKLDFDAARSVVKAGISEMYNLKPVIRASAEAQDGAISGIILPLEATPAVYAIQGSDTITSAFTDETGAFLLQDLEPGTYKVGVDPASGYNQHSVENVDVSLGSITDIGTITLSE